MLVPLLLNNMMSQSADFVIEGAVDFGCEPLPQSTVSRRSSISTGRSSGFVRSRQRYDRPVRIVTLDWNMATEGTKLMVESVFDDTLGGTLSMDYVPKNGEVPYRVRFANRPNVERSQSAAAYQLQVILEEVL